MCLDENIHMLCSIIAFGRFLGIDSTGISMLEVCEVISKKKPCLGHNCSLISEHVDKSKPFQRLSRNVMFSVQIHFGLVSDLI